VRRFVARGGRVLYGTDLGNQGPPPGSTSGELRLLVEAGLEPGQALAAATSGAPPTSASTDTGRVEAGARADLLLVDGDPAGRPGRTWSGCGLVTRDGWVAENSPA
jgi:imidazolonepropionase-like amidohydrolase